VINVAQRAALRRDGYVVLPGAVPRPLVERALSAINQCLGRGLDPRRLEDFRARSFCPELQGDPAITDLARDSGVWAAAESLLGRGQVSRPRTGQVALSFPTPGPPARPHAHLDGMYSPKNGVPRGEILSFTMLAGVMLSDVVGPSSGNLVVWPRTHEAYEDYFRRRGPQSLLEGMPDVPLGEPVAVTGRAGDAVLCHYQLAHAAGPNTSPHVRYAAYFRLEHVDHRRQRWECLTDIWREWPGI
jgi:Phytanoyl-CoA dioxygenase (PhyH)